MIEFHAVSKRFGDRVVLDDFSLVIPEGETTVLLGYSGTGKSVALKHIVGLIEPDAGQIEVDGEVVNQLEYDELMRLRARIGYVFQFAALFDSLSVGENLALGLRRQGLDPAKVDARVAESLRLVELEGAAERYPSELSGGMRKRVGIARAIALRPRYILYDEPTTGLDPVTTAAIDDLMVRARQELGATSVVVTHDLRSAFAVADRIAFLYEGRIRRVGSTAEIRETTDPLVRDFLDGRAGTGGRGQA
ncbi:MAG TPA: ATP-binding cassette domain-containing protein [Gemmatimonadales bacterium]|jgi:phospholipid/cholesterol/gamma-HCH transport system ATP-binding protein|nr:ATP-binding cassette domain-containing protein [Gemmatimonadales bacterium]